MPARPQAAGPSSQSSPLSGHASTGQVNTFQVTPFALTRVASTSAWDPGNEPLWVGYVVQDANRRARAGCILYITGGGDRGDEVVLHVQSLRGDEIAPGPHVTDTWDGKITQGLPNRRGSKATADLSPITVRVQLWNLATAAPGQASQSGPTSNPGEYLSQDEVAVPIQAVASASWERDTCLPYNHPDQPALGETRMKIHVQNVADGTPVRLLVARIGDVDDPSSDIEYIRSGKRGQPGLARARVQNRKVMLEDGALPYVRFNQYAKHWTGTTRDLYCVYVAFGRHGDWMVASERDYKTKEKKCLLMLFSVFIYHPPVKGKKGKPPSQAWTDSLKAAREVNDVFCQYPRYYHCTLMADDWPDLRTMARLLRHRFITIFASHGLATCIHPNHPKRLNGRPKEVPLVGFAPDLNVCPPADLLREDYMDRDGCNNYDGVGVFLMAKTTAGKWVLLGSFPPSMKMEGLYAWQLARTPKCEADLWVPANRPVLWGNCRRLKHAAPRGLMDAAGCRTVLTDCLAKTFTRQGTRYFIGWEHGAGVEASAEVMKNFYTGWIRGWKGDEPTSPYQAERMFPTFQWAVSSGWIACFHPRLTDSSLVLSPKGPQPPPPVADQQEGVMA